MGQDRSPEVQFITLDEAKGRAAGAATSNIPQLGINAAKYHRQAAQADYFPKLNADFLNLHFNKFMGQTIQLLRRDASLPLFGKDWTGGRPYVHSACHTVVTGTPGGRCRQGR